MNKAFPYDNYRFGLCYINKGEYDSSINTGNPYSPKDIAEEIIGEINISSLSTYSRDIYWNTTDIDPGDYYIFFQIEEENPSTYVFMIVKDARIEITIN